MAPFWEKLRGAMEETKSHLCVGLDPEPERLPQVLRSSPDGMLRFNRAIVEATQDIACAYKANLAFYQVLGRDGWQILEETFQAIPPHIPTILDAKFNDIGNTARLYAKAAFEIWGADAVTVNPYLGYDGMKPFASYTDKAVFLLARTSNPGAKDFQDLDVAGDPLYLAVARQAQEWNRRGNLGLVVGATYPEELAQIRKAAPALPFLVPGVGAQGGSLEEAIRHGATAEGFGPLIAISRAIIYASSGPDYAQAARNAALGYRQEIEGIRRRQKG